MQDVLTREYHGHIVVSRQCEQSKEDSDGWDHMLISHDFTEAKLFPTLANAIATAKLITAARRREEEERQKETEEEKTRVAETADREELSPPPHAATSED